MGQGKLLIWRSVDIMEYAWYLREAGGEGGWFMVCLESVCSWCVLVDPCGMTEQ